MRPYFCTGTQSSLTIPLFLILFSNISAMKADRTHRNEARAENNPRGLFPAHSANKAMDVLNIISDSTMTASRGSNETAKAGNTTGPDDELVVSDETEDEEDESEGEEDMSYDEEEDQEPEEDDEFEEGEEDEDEEEDEEKEEEVEESFQADVRSLSDLPLSRLLQVRGELQRIEEKEEQQVEEVAETRALSTQSSLAKLAKSTKAALGAAAKATAAAGYNQPKNKHYSSHSNFPNAYQGSSRKQKLPAKEKQVVDSDDSKDVPPRRGGWHFDEEEEEEEYEEDHGWVSSWPKGKKKKKGDISSVFQMSVTFLAFLAFGGYLLCLIVQAVKGGGPTAPTADGYRPPMTSMVLMMPARLGVRRPRPPNPGRRRRRRRRRRRNASESPDEDVPWPAWSNQFNADGTGRLWPNVDLSSIQQVLFDISRELAENGPILR